MSNEIHWGFQTVPQNARIAIAYNNGIFCVSYWCYSLQTYKAEKMQLKFSTFISLRI